MNNSQLVVRRRNKNKKNNSDDNILNHRHHSNNSNTDNNRSESRAIITSVSPISPSYEPTSVIEPIDLHNYETERAMTRSTMTNDEWKVVMQTSHSQHLVLYNPIKEEFAVFSRANGYYDEYCPLCGQNMPISSSSDMGTNNHIPLPNWHRMQQRYFNITSAHYQRQENNDSDKKDNIFNNNEHEDDGGLSLNNGYYNRFFDEVKLLGRGSYGSVYLSKHEMDGICIGMYAVKKVPVGASHSWLRRVLREVKALEALHHPNIVSYRHSWLEQYRPSDFGPSVPCLFILMEFANCGNIGDLVWIRKPNYCKKLKWHGEYVYDRIVVRNTTKFVLKESFIWKLFIDICKGLEHLHLAGVLHRDVKCENMLLTSLLWERTHHIDGFWEIGELPSDVRVLLSDMGECIMKGAQTNRSGNTGTLVYCAPETLVTEQINNHPRPAYVFTEAADIWSLGIVLYVMSYNCLPFNGELPDEMLNNIMESSLLFPSQPERSADLINLIKDMLNIDPQLRPTITEVLHRALLYNNEEEMNDTFAQESSSPVAPTKSSTPLALNWYSTPFQKLVDTQENTKYEWIQTLKVSAHYARFILVPLFLHIISILFKIWLYLQERPISVYNILIITFLSCASLLCNGIFRESIWRVLPAIAAYIWLIFTLNNFTDSNILISATIVTIFQFIPWFHR